MSTEPSGELTALKELLASEGWAQVLAAYEREWGAEATLQKIQQRVAQVPMGDHDAVQDMTQHVLSAQRAVKLFLGQFAERVKALTTEEKPRLFGRHRRV